jgi:hypothetical protein
MATTTLDTISDRPSDRLAALGSKGRSVAYQESSLSPAELSAWAALYPDEIPLVNGELPWIVATLADLE